MHRILLQKINFEFFLGAVCLHFFLFTRLVNVLSGKLIVELLLQVYIMYVCVHVATTQQKIVCLKSWTALYP